MKIIVQFFLILILSLPRMTFAQNEDFLNQLLVSIDEFSVGTYAGSLKDFADKNPDSRFSDDAILVELILTSGVKFRSLMSKNGSLTDQDSRELDTLKHNAMMFRTLYGDKSLEEETGMLFAKQSSRLEDFSMNPQALYLRYSLIENYFSAMLAFMRGNYDDAIKEGLVLKDAYDWKGGSTILGSMVFTHLMACYMQKRDVNASLDLAKEAMGYFPDSQWPKGFYDLIQKKKAQWDKKI